MIPSVHPRVLLRASSPQQKPCQISAVTTSRLLPSNTTSDQPPLPTNTPR
ncbi:hypothetical protein HMPREF9595_00995 [Cutibacterium acnes HL005PA2]|nr:hypothetical protein HMPREF9575_01007 [Cutibacterium acnes HL110PA1]EFT31638.1 hypothetical protein HMPREF9595_00995 [Cutibacterium acnes HL005PA2]EGE92066.1 hypothetical protein HMPREF9568_01174 [Cutibacterium acnes HL013PA2]